VRSSGAYLTADVLGQPLRRLTRLVALRNTVLVAGGYLPLLLVLAVAPTMIRECRLSISALLGTISYRAWAARSA
jgi:hypothetical protein